jgi:hypothetical protein
MSDTHRPCVMTSRHMTPDRMSSAASTSHELRASVSGAYTHPIEINESLSSPTIHTTAGE